VAGKLYATRETMDEKARVWLSRLPRRRRWPLPRPEESALLVIDMQNFFLDEASYAFIPVAREMVDAVNAFARAMEDAGGKVIYTVHVQDVGDEGVMAEWWRDVIREGVWAEIHPSVEVHGPVLRKPRYSPFYRTDLEVHLKGVKNIFIAGVMTNVCCETAARDAFVRDYRPFMLADATATVSEELHVASLTSLSHGVAEVLTCEEARRRLSL